MSAFVVFTADDKPGVHSPEVVGPFADRVSAWDFIRQHPRHLGGAHLKPIDGGYAGAVLVSAEVAIDPVTYMEEEQA